MSLQAALAYSLLAAAILVAALITMHVIWRGVGIYRIRRAGPRRLKSSHHRIWREPGSIEQLDLAGGPGGVDGAPVAPFTFLEEHSIGSQPCVSVYDARGRRWRVKWGHEVNAEAFAVRVAFACGYFAEITHFVSAGTVPQASSLSRASACIDAQSGHFADARFELDDPTVNKLFEEHSWAWNDNPFVGTRELNGLKILVMLLSNWDTKDRRDVARGSNTGIFEVRIGGKRPWARHEAQYLITDWGGAMGKWGANLATRGRWDAQGFTAQTPQFVTGVSDGVVLFGYAGQRTADIARDIPVEHVRWFHQIVSRIDRRQLVAALTASGASTEEQARFADALLERINQLGKAAVEAMPAERRAG